MILQRLADAIRKQSWFTVILEIVIVVVGLFSGLQVDDWNEARKARAQEIVYLERIVDDLFISIQATRANIDEQKNRARRAAVVLDTLKACEIRTEEQREFANGIYHLGKIEPVVFASTTIDELRSAGQFTILRNAELRQQIGRTMQRLEVHQAFITDLQGRLAPQINYVDRRVALRIRGPVGGAADIDWHDVEMDFQMLCQEQHFFNAVSAALNYTWDVIAANIDLSNDIQALMINVESELASLHGPRP